MCHTCAQGEHQYNRADKEAKMFMCVTITGPRRNYSWENCVINVAEETYSNQKFKVCAAFATFAIELDCVSQPLGYVARCFLWHW